MAAVSMPCSTAVLCSVNPLSLTSSAPESAAAAAAAPAACPSSSPAAATAACPQILGFLGLQSAPRTYLPFALRLLPVRLIGSCGCNGSDASLVASAIRAARRRVGAPTWSLSPVPLLGRAVVGAIASRVAATATISSSINRRRFILIVRTSRSRRHLRSALAWSWGSSQ
ncbi:hypothetical protein COO60DRAFT_1546956, partial [Scenedesmus sp. NREL 46B-D3]